MHELERGQDNQDNLLDRIDIVHQRLEDNIIEAHVPLNLIYREDVQVDNEHVAKLAASMREEVRHGRKTGQLEAVFLAHVPKFGLFPIINGFHRVTALENNGATQVYASIRPNSTWENVIDLRILNAVTQKSVKFSRVIDWVEEAWRLSLWQGRISAYQAFALTTQPKMTGKILGITPQEAEAIKEWVLKKSDQWEMSAHSIHQNLYIARLAPPDLVREVRGRPSGHRLEAITAQHLKAMVSYLGHQDDLLRLVAEVTKQHALTVPQTKQLALAVSKAKTPTDIKKLIADRVWEWQPVIPQLSEQTVNLQEQIFEREVHIAELMIENAQLAGRYDPKTAISEAKPDGEGTPQVVESEEGESIPVSPEAAAQIALVLPEMTRLTEKLIAYLYYKFGIHTEEASDIVTEAQARTIQFIRQGRFVYINPQKLSAWMNKVVRNIAIDQDRRKHDVVEVELEESATPDTNGEQFDEEFIDILRRAIPHLTYEQRTVILLLELFNLTNFEACQVMAQSEMSIKSVLFRARNSIRRLITTGKI